MQDNSFVNVDVHLPVDWSDAEMRADMMRAFSNSPIVLPPKWLYDERGSELFTAITRIDDYYPTEAERSLLAESAGEIVACTRADTLVELGSGTSEKTTTLLDAMETSGNLRTFVPVDVSEETLRSAATRLRDRYPQLYVQGVVGDFTRHLGRIPNGSQRLFAFLGGTIGNFYPEERADFFSTLSGCLQAGEWLLVGFDLLKDVNKVLRAYHDVEGVTAQFVTNVLQVVNSKLKADFQLSAFDYVPFWDNAAKRVDMRLRVRSPQKIRIEELGLDVDLGEGEEIRVEISTKFDPGDLAAELATVGFDVANLFLAPGDEFGLVLAQRAS